MSRESEFVDLGREVVRDKHGRRITEDEAAAAAEALENDDVEIVDVTYPRTGRPSLGKPGSHAPRFDVRVPQEVKVSIEKLAHRQGRRSSDLVREALDEYLARH